MHYTLRLLLALILVPVGLGGIAWLSAISMPVERHAKLIAPGAAGQRIVLLGDLHLINRATGAARLRRIVDQVNALRPDVVLIAGDMIAGHAPVDAEAGAPVLAAELRRLTPRLGTVAVLGNHDNWTGPARVTAALRGAGITVLENDAVRIGAFAVIGVGDDFSQHSDVARAQAAARKIGGLAIYLTHSPDIAPSIPAGLILAGHTHCGQVVLPLIGPVNSVTRYGARYQCGMVREGTRTVIVTAGTGTSVVPLRFFAPPDLWVLDVRR